MFGFVGNSLAVVRDFFVESWVYLKSSNATFNRLGDDLITSAQNDLMNLKGKLDKLWEIQDQDKETAALYVSAVLGKFGFTFIIIGVSSIASLLKLSGGSLCLFLAGRWLTLGSKLLTIFREVFAYSLTWLQSSLGNLVTNALELCSKITRSLGDYAGRFLKASLNVLLELISYLSSAWQIILDLGAAAVRGFVSAMKWIGNGLLNAWQITLDFAAAASRAIGKIINAIVRLAKNVVRNFGSAIINCFKGVGQLILGTLRASVIVAKGVVLSVAALFIETGIANSLSGVAKTIFILDESLAAGIGALMDGVYASGNSFVQAAKSIFGYGVTIPVATTVRAQANMIIPVATEANEHDIEVNADAAEIASGLGDSTYFSRNARDNMHYVNGYFATAGNNILRVYQEQRDNMTGASSWLQDEHVEAVRLDANYRPLF